MSEEAKTTAVNTKTEETDSSSLLLDEAAPQHLFILKNNDNSLKGAEQFLKNRGWKIASSTHLKKALLYIIQNLPTFVMISSDHSHPKVKILPKLLKQVLPIHVIGFAESQMTSSNLNLDAMKLEYALFAPVSGPQILRIVTLIIREYNKSLKEAPEENEHPHSNTEITGKENSNLLTIKGGKKPSRDPLSLQKAREALQKAFAGDDADPAGGDASFFIPESPSSASQSAELSPNISKDLQSNSDHLEKDSTLGSVLYQKNSPSQGIQGNFSPDKAHESQNDYNPNVSKSSDDPFLQTQLKSTSARKLEKNSSDEEFRIKRGVEKYGESETLISKGVEHAIELKTNLENPVPVHSTLTKNTNIACIIVESPKFSGYLIAAMGSDRKMDNAFTRMLQRRLFEFLKSKGEQVSDQDVLNLKLQEVEFQDWSIEQADFLKKSIHEGSEIAMAFFPIDDTNVKLRESKSEKMAKISLKDLKPDTTLEFDLYLHLEANDRYILYTPQDGVFHASQKERLMAKGITDLHLRKDAVNNVKKYKAQNYLNEKIEAYKNKSKT